MSSLLPVLNAYISRIFRLFAQLIISNFKNILEKYISIVASSAQDNCGLARPSAYFVSG